MRNIVIKQGEDGFFVAEVPSLPGCISQGKTYQEALSNIIEAMELYIEALQEDEIPVSEENIMFFSIPEPLQNRSRSKVYA